MKNSPRAPLGPSDVLIEGIPFSRIAIDRQKSAPASNEICSSEFTEPQSCFHFQWEIFHVDYQASLCMGRSLDGGIKRQDVESVVSRLAGISNIKPARSS